MEGKNEGGTGCGPSGEMNSCFKYVNLSLRFVCI